MPETALITGVGRRVGIGYAIARRLAERGADLFLHSWAPGYDDPETIDALRTELPDTRIEHAEADFMDPDAPERLVDRAIAAFGRLDKLIVNHAHSSNYGLGELTPQEIDRALIVNVRAPLLLVQAFHARHDGGDGGRVILMTSGQHRGPMPGELPYIAGKGALHQLTNSLAAAVADKRITLNTVDPGATDTGYATPELHQQILEHEPFGRWGEPDDAARLIAFLCSDDARWITGQVITSCGGGP
jgi:3-oxoacyl-[acyl-carrier protein] reductase